MVALAVTAVLVVPAIARTGTRAHLPTVKVTERDFSISAPKTVASGEISIVVHNAGPDTHELIMVRANGKRLPLRSDGLTVNEEALQPRTVESLDGAPTGAVRTVTVHLAPGRYVLFCNMAGHYLGGMHTTLVVK
ncbi:MAG TPA: hypothetical protein VLJ76_07775 [Gaiellaceae bacterium]|nr:hypothetical protein [Gaiellaceae bacterium]